MVVHITTLYEIVSTIVCISFHQVLHVTEASGTYMEYLKVHCMILYEPTLVEASANPAETTGHYLIAQFIAK